jgi:hypothetical protein
VTTNEDTITRLREAFMELTKEECCGNTWYGPSAKTALAFHRSQMHLRGHDESPDPYTRSASHE